MRASLRLLAFALLVCCGTLAFAQTEQRGVDDPVYPFWDEVAENAETILDDAETTTTEELEALRSRIATFRNEFSKQRDLNADRIANLESQLNALGTPPEGVEEPDELANQRAGLQIQLEELLAPVRVADVAFRRADGLISEVDVELRNRQTRRLLALGPSPFDVRIWPEAFTDMSRSLRDILPISSGYARDQTPGGFADKLPLVIFIFIVSFTLCFNGRNWANAAVDRMRAMGGRGSGVWRFLASLLRIFIPMLGVYGVTYAARLTGVLSAKEEALVGLLPVYGLVILVLYWLGERLFPRSDEDTPLPLQNERRSVARLYVLLLAILLVVRGVIDVVFSLEQATASTVAVVAFPVVVLTALPLFSLGRLLRRRVVYPGADDSSTDKRSGLARGVRLIGTFMMVVAVVAPVMAGIGYAEAGNALLYPTLISVMVLGLLLVMQRFLADVYGLLTGQGAEVREGLVAIFIAFFLILIALPLLAVVWGVRVTDLTELWNQFLEGFEIGGTRISPSDFLTFAIVFGIGYTLTRLIQSTLRNNVLPKTRIDVGGQNALVSGTGYVGIFLAALVGVSVAGLDLSGIALVAGALSVGIGFGLQTIVSNFVSGIILLVERPVSEGDWIEVGGQMGYVKDISVRATRIETFDRTDVIVPNSDLISGTVTNYTRGNTIGRLIVKVGVAYGTDTKLVDKILRDVAEAQPMVMSKPPPSVLFMGFGADALEFEIRAILRDINWVLNVQNDMNHDIAKRFADAGIEIPFAQRDIWLRNPEALRSQDRRGEAEGLEFGEDEPIFDEADVTDEEDVSDDAEGSIEGYGK